MKTCGSTPRDHCLLSASAADAPYWWIAHSVLDTNAVANDYAAVNQGQAKWMAVQAAAELDRLLPGGAGPTISNLTAGLSSGGNELPLNLGQLKFLAAPFYDRIRAEGFTNALPEEMPGFYPWTGNSSDDNDFAPANIGQLKRVFSFDLDMCFDTDGDGIPDGMEGRWDLNKYNPADAALPSTNPWAHGLTNLQVFQNRSVLRADNFSTLSDGIPDWWKVKHGYAVTDGLVFDDDGDSWTGLEEYQRGSDPRRYDRLTLRFERREMTATKGGFREFQQAQPPKVAMYLRQNELWGNWIVDPYPGCAPVGPGTAISIYDIATGNTATEPLGIGGSIGTPPATSPTSRVGMVVGTETCGACQWVEGSGWWSTNEETQEVTWETSEGYWTCPGHDGLQEVQIGLFDEFTTDTLLGRLATMMPPFLDEFDQVWVDDGFFGFEPDPLQPTPAAWFDVSSDELTAGAGKIQYKFWLDSSPHDRFVSWMEIFTPENDPATPQDESATPEYTFRHWPDETHPDTGQDETPVYTINPLAAPDPREGSYRIVILKVDMTAHRPQTEGPGYGSPFQKHEVPEDKEESPGVGIRYNGDDDDGDTIVDRSDGSVAGENDLIEVILTAVPPSTSGLEYVLKRSNSDLRVWDNSTKGKVLLGGSDEEVITFATSTRTVWVERSGTSDSTDLEFFARPTGTTQELCQDTLHFYTFKSVVVFFEGEQRNPHDPPTTGNPIQDFIGVGISTMALDLYLDGYDVHNYEDSPSSVGFDEVKSAVTDRDVDHVALIGYSHGGGSVYDVSVALAADPTTFNLDFTAYIDAIAQPAANPFPETHRPVNAAFHVNYYQEIQLGETPLQGAASLSAGAGFDGYEDNVDQPTATESHPTIDDATSIQTAIINYLKSKVDP